MIKISDFKSIDEKGFDRIQDKYTFNDSTFASVVGIYQSSVSLKRHRGFKLSFSQAFTFYANYFLSDSEMKYLIEQMRKDGFEINEE